MAEIEDAGRKRLNVAVLSGDAGKLTDAHIKDLREKFGLEIRIRSESAAVNKLISRIDLASSYDRTHPGYGRVYDKDPDVGSEIGALIRPGGGEF